jgi:hypothetical protein
VDYIIYQAGLGLGLSPTPIDRLGLKHSKRDEHVPDVDDAITEAFVSKLRDLIKQYGINIPSYPTKLIDYLNR